MDHSAEFNVELQSMDQYAFRLEAFKDTDDFIKEWNGKGYNLQHNELSVLTSEEINLMSGFDVDSLELDIQLGAI